MNLADPCGLPSPAPPSIRVCGGPPDRL